MAALWWDKCVERIGSSIGDPIDHDLLSMGFGSIDEERADQKVGKIGHAATALHMGREQMCVDHAAVVAIDLWDGGKGQAADRRMDHRFPT